jgi:L-amino acid N-acyltransferase YncA
MKAELIPAKVQNAMLRVFSKRYEHNFSKKPSQLKLRQQARKFQKSFDDKKLHFKLDAKNNLVYFFMFDKTFMGEFQEHFFHVTSFYCINSSSARRLLYKDIDKAASEMKKLEGLKRMSIEVSAEDQESIDRFSKLGKLTYTLLIGNTKKSLGILEKETTSPKIKISLGKKAEISKLIRLDLDSHLHDKSSRMHDLYKTMDRANFNAFYGRLVKRKSLFVARENKQILGSIGYFEDVKNNQGLIAQIFVAHKHKGRGVSKLLYKKVLLEFKKKNLSYYVGGSTTKGVLALAKKMERVQSRHVYLVKIKS